MNFTWWFWKNISLKLISLKKTYLIWKYAEYKRTKQVCLSNKITHFINEIFVNGVRPKFNDSNEYINFHIKQLK